MFTRPPPFLFAGTRVPPISLRPASSFRYFPTSITVPCPARLSISLIPHTWPVRILAGKFFNHLRLCQNDLDDTDYLLSISSDHSSSPGLLPPTIPIPLDGVLRVHCTAHFVCPSVESSDGRKKDQIRLRVREYVGLPPFVSRTSGSHWDPEARNLEFGMWNLEVEESGLSNLGTLGLVPFLAYHQILMVLILVAIILLCKLKGNCCSWYIPKGLYCSL